MRASAWLLAVLCVACSGAPRALPAAPSRPPLGSTTPLHSVGASPRLLATLDLRDARIRAQLAALSPLLVAMTEHPATDCKVSLDELQSIRGAAGEPGRVLIEIEGAITSSSLACVLGAALLEKLTKASHACRSAYRA